MHFKSTLSVKAIMFSFASLHQRNGQLPIYKSFIKISIDMIQFISNGFFACPHYNRNWNFDLYSLIFFQNLQCQYFLEIKKPKINLKLFNPKIEVH